METLKSLFGHEHNGLPVGKRTIECYILPKLEPVLEKRSFQRALGYDGRSTRWLYDFLIHLSRNIPISVDLLDAIQENRHFEVRGQNGDIALKLAIEPHIALKVCQIITQANKQGQLYLSELKYAKAADTMLQSFDDHTVLVRIRFVTGFDRYKLNVREKTIKTLFKANPDLVYRWILTIPDAFLESVFEFYGIGWEDAADHTDEIAAFLDEFLFSRLDPDNLLALQTKPRMIYSKEYFTEKYQENPVFSQQMQGLWALMRLSNRHLALLTPLTEKAYPARRSPVAAKKNPEVRPPESFKLAVIKGVSAKRKR